MMTVFLFLLRLELCAETFVSSYQKSGACRGVGPSRRAVSDLEF